MVILLTNCTVDTTPKQTKEDEEKILPDQESWDMSFEATEDGRVTAKLWFGHVSQFNEKRQYEFDQNFKVDFYNEKGKITSWMTGERGILKENRTIMEAFGNVIVHSDSSETTLYTESLFWNDNKKKITTEDFVTVTTPQDTIYGKGFESETDFSRWEIKQSRGHTKRPVDIGFDQNPKSKKDIQVQKNE